MVRSSDLVKHPPANGIDVGELRAFVAALDDSTLPILRTNWIGADAARMDGVLGPDHVISVATNFDKGWIRDRHCRLVFQANPSAHPDHSAAQAPDIKMRIPKLTERNRRHGELKI